jgi:Ca2+-binding RTX toxin-like protein
VLIDGPGNDTLYGFGLDDALINNEGADNLQGGNGSDLLLSATTCGGDILQGAEGKKGDGDSVNNASWSQLPASSGGVVADLMRGKAGSQYTEAVISSASSTAGPSAQASAGKGEGKGRGKGKGGGGKGGAGGPSCTSGALDRLANVDDLEGSSQADALYGDARDNNLLGRKGEDLLFGRAGEDRIAAQDGERDNVGGGSGADLCIHDKGLDTLTSCNP